jgi:multisubunit Na+/H+ antiporter MnhB subunit
MNVTLVWDALLIVGLLLVSWRLLGASDLFQAMVLFICFGLFLSLAWIRLQAPDVALAEAAVGAGLAGVLLFGAFSGPAAQPGRGASARQRPPRQLRRAAGGSDLKRRLLVGSAAGVLAVLLSLAVWELPRSGVGQTDGVAQALGSSGVTHPVTAVLLNFRLYDTWLELGVLLLALLGVLAVSGRQDLAGLASRRTRNILLPWLVKGLAPIVFLATTHLLWLGDHAPGGAFQAGVVLAAGLVLLWLSGHPSVTLLRPAVWRVCLVAGFGAILLMAALTTLAEASIGLEYPAKWAALLILLLESIATLTIGVTLASLAVLSQTGDAGNDNG